MPPCWSSMVPPFENALSRRKYKTSCVHTPMVGQSNFCKVSFIITFSFYSQHTIRDVAQTRSTYTRAVGQVDISICKCRELPGIQGFIMGVHSCGRFSGGTSATDISCAMDEPRKLQFLREFHSMGRSPYIVIKPCSKQCKNKQQKFLSKSWKIKT